MSGAVQTHLDAIHSGFVERSNVLGIRKILNANWRKSRGYSVSRTSAKINSGDVRKLQHDLELAKPIVRGALHDSGLKLLRSKRYRKRLEPYADMIAEIVYFRLIRFDAFGQNGSHHVPVYRAVTRYGDGFTFRNIPWQSGGDGPEIVRINY